MSVRLRVSGDTIAAPETVWRELTDWVGQRRWVPFTRVKVTSPHTTGLGVRAEALSGFYLGRLPVGLLDRFVVTGWTPPAPGTPAELEVLHLGPYFTGEGVFRLEAFGTGTKIICTEVVGVPGGPLPELLVRFLLPLLRSGFRSSLRRLAAVCEGGP